MLDRIPPHAKSLHIDRINGDWTARVWRDDFFKNSRKANKICLGRIPVKEDLVSPLSKEDIAFESGVP